MLIFKITILLLMGWVTLLAMNISRLRFKERVGIGHGDRLSLKKAIRAHMNTIEHAVPFGFLLYVVSSSELTSASVLLGVSIAFGISRIIHAFSFYISNDFLRQSSVGLTYLCELILLCIGFINLI